MRIGEVTGRRGAVGMFALALGLAACGSSSPTVSRTPRAASPTATASTSSGCAARAGVTGKVDDRGTRRASGSAISLDAGDFFFSPTCVVGTGTLRVTVKNVGAMLHNISVTDQKIDKDVPKGATVTVKVTIPASGSVPFFCKYHVSAGMQGALLGG